MPPLEQINKNLPGQKVSKSAKWEWTEYDSKTDSETNDWQQETVNESEHYNRFLSTKRISANLGEQWVSNPSLGTSLLIACYGKSIFKNIYAATHVATPTTKRSTKRHRADNKVLI